LLSFIGEHRLSRDGGNQVDQANARGHIHGQVLPSVVAALALGAAHRDSLDAFATRHRKVLRLSDNLQFVSFLGAAGVLELGGGLLILIGLFTRPVAFILSGFMAVAYFMAHAPQGFYPLLNQGELAVLFCFVFLYFSVAGGGAWSLDAARRAA